jgi:hypothetical protein
MIVDHYLENGNAIYCIIEATEDSYFKVTDNIISKVEFNGRSQYKVLLGNQIGRIYLTSLFGIEFPNADYYKIVYV